MRSVSAPPGTECRALTATDLDAVMHLEVQAYDFPWTRGNFLDSLLAGYWAYALFQCSAEPQEKSPALLAYAWAMAGVGELHLLNITVARCCWGRGYAQFLLDRLVAWGHEIHAEDLWLEVRPSNLRAIALYERYGFKSIACRRHYYPALAGGREDAMVMSFKPFGGQTIPEELRGRGVRA
ncbi:MAG: ribosomal protein S18-alanine N-acetyltransferase [Burkholderiales bacterium]